MILHALFQFLVSNYGSNQAQKRLPEKWDKKPSFFLFLCFFVPSNAMRSWVSDSSCFCRDWRRTHTKKLSSCWIFFSLLSFPQKSFTGLMVSIWPLNESWFYLLPAQSKFITGEESGFGWISGRQIERGNCEGLKNWTAIRIVIASICLRQFGGENRPRSTCLSRGLLSLSIATSNQVGNAFRQGRSHDYSKCGKCKCFLLRWAE